MALPMLGMMSLDPRQPETLCEILGMVHPPCWSFEVTHDGCILVKHDVTGECGMEEGIEIVAAPWEALGLLRAAMETHVEMMAADAREASASEAKSEALKA